MAGVTKTNVQLGDSTTATNNFMLTAQAADGTMKLARGNNGATTQDVLTVDSSGKVALGQGSAGGFLTLATAQNTVSVTAVDFTSIPSWVKRITMMLNGVSTNGISKLRIQLGGGSVETSGYAGSGSYVASASAGSANFTAGFELTDEQTANAIRHGALTFTLFGANLWVATGGIGQSNASYSAWLYGTKTTAATLDRIRLTTVNGTDIFDAGSVNIMYEG